MKNKIIFWVIILSLILEAVLILGLINKKEDYKNDTIAINMLKREIESNYGNTKKYPNTFEYSIIDNNDNVIYKTNDNVSKSINEAYHNKDTIIDLDNNKGKIIVSNNVNEIINKNNNVVITVVIVITIIQLVSYIIYYVITYTNLIKPFRRMEEFATRISSGNLDIPISMDKNNNFGAFTEAFDIMRAEIKRSREQEKKAVESKKELIAKLSHDIKTPISSIKSSSELGSIISKDEKSKEYFELINIKSDQINTLITNLFNSTLDELEELNINAVELKSNVISELINNADYLNKNNNYDIPKCNIFADRIRLQQVFDNIFANSYKYANTEIETRSYIDKGYLVIEIKDFGNTVKDEEIPLLTEKFKRGSNIDNNDGVGLGLYISKELMLKMNGDLEIQNCNPGFKVVLNLRII